MKKIRFIKPIIFLLALITLGIGLFYFFSKPAGASWFDENWAYRKAIPISAHTALENNVYITVTIDTSTPITASKMQSDCGDLRFTKENGEILPYFINASPGCNNAATTIQVNFDSFPAGAQTIYYYYGNPSAPNGFSAAAFSTAATGVTIGSVGSETQGPGPLAYWKFDDGQGTTAKNDTSNGSSLDGTLSGTTKPTWQTEDQCVSGKCLYFDGSTSYISVSKQSSLEGASNFSMGAWIKTSSTSNQGVMGQFDVGNHIMAMYIDGATGNTYFITYEGGYSNIATTTVVNDGKWHHIEITKSGTTGNIYIDGMLKKTGTVANVSSTTEIRIGERENGVYPFKGNIDEVKIYSYTRTAAQIKQDYLAGLKNAGAKQGDTAVLGAQPEDYLSNGLVGYWKMDESSWNGTTGEVKDASGNGYNGTAAKIGTPSIPTTGAGKYSNGASLAAGANNNNAQYITMGNVEDMGASQSFTLSVWAKFSTQGSANNYPGIICKGNTQSGASYCLNIGTTTVYFTLVDGTNTLYSPEVTGNDNVWHNYTAVFDRTNQTGKLYKDGVFQSSSNISSIGSLSNSNSFVIGGRQDSTAIRNGLTGLVDEVRVYNRALSPKEVSDLYNWAPGPIGYWNFEEGSGTSANDLSSNGNTGTITNAIWSVGKFGSGLKFDGSGDYVTRADNTIYDFAAANNFTVAAWVKHNGAIATNSDYILTKGDTTNGGYQLYMDSSGNFCFGVDDDGNPWGPDDSACSSGTNYSNDNKWHHVTGVKTGTTKIELFVDGVSAGSDSTIAATGTLANSGALYIGIDYDGSSNGWDGWIDEPKIYNYARTAKQIVSDMNAGHPAVGSPIGSAVGYWKFDEGQGQTANNSGNGSSTYNGTLGATTGSSTDDPTWSTAGKYGKALSFDGGDYISLSSLNTNYITVSAWINPSALPGTDARSRILAKYSGTGSTSGHWVFDLVNNSGTQSLRFLFWGPSANSGSLTTTLSTSTWTYVSATYDGSNIKIYLNGVLRSTTAATDSTIPNVTQTLTIGGDTAGAGSTAFFNGIIDEAKVYNYALTADEVKTDYNRGSSMVLGVLSDKSGNQAQSQNNEYCIPGDTSTCTAPVGRWDFEEGRLDSCTGGTNDICDLSGNGNDGAFEGTSRTFTIGKYGKAMLLNGTDNFFYGNDMNSIDGLTTMTVEAWINPSALTDWAGIARKGYTNSTKWVFSLGGLGEGGNDDIEININNGTTGNAGYTTGNFISTNTWTHVAFAYDGTQSTNATKVIAYINGIPRTLTFVGTIPTSLATNSDNLEIGKGPIFLAGRVDHFQIYDYVRTPAQIAWDYNKGAPVGWWKMDECQGTVTNDSSGNKNTGTITIGATGGEDTLGTCNTSSTAWGSGATGKRNSSLSLDGTDDKIITSAFSLLATAGLTTSKFSWGGWFYPTTSAASKTLLEKASEFQLTTDASSMPICGVYYSSAFHNSAAPTTALTLSAWNHVVCTYDGTNINTYLNGKLIKQSAETTAVTAASSILYFGVTSGDANFYSGQLDDVRMYNYALTGTQVKLLYNNGAINFGPVTGTP